MSEIDDRIAAILAQEPVWEPPAGFRHRVVAMVPQAKVHRWARGRISTWGAFDAALPGLLVVAAGWVVGLVWDPGFVDVVNLAWLCAALSLGAGATLMRR